MPKFYNRKVRNCSFKFLKAQLVEDLIMKETLNPNAGWNGCGDMWHDEDHCSL